MLFQGRLKSNKVAEKPLRLWDKIEVIYDGERWMLLKSLRAKAIQAMRALERRGIKSFLHGSVARGDVDKYSDIDIIVPFVTPTYEIEGAIESNYKIYKRTISQATPSHTVKGHIYLDLDEKFSITFPLLSFRSLEVHFYKFGGLCSIMDVKKGKRTPGCTKKLTLVEPIELGHIEYYIVGIESEVARKLKIDPEIIRERERVLNRRDRVGRTGIFLNRSLKDGETFEGTLKKLVDSNPAVKRSYYQRTRYHR